MNPFTQDINRILGAAPTKSAKPLTEPMGEFQPFEPYSKSTSSESEPVVTPAETLSLQEISNGFERQSRRYSRSLSTDTR